MTHVRFFRRNGVFCGMTAWGHSGYGESGSDIVCAAVSTAVGIVLRAVGDVAKVDADATAEEETATVTLRLPNDLTDRQQTLCSGAMEAAYLWLKENVTSYGAYLRVSLQDEPAPHI